MKKILAFLLALIMMLSVFSACGEEKKSIDQLGQDEPTADDKQDTTSKDEPTDKPTDKPADEPADEPADKPADEPTDKPADEPKDEPTDKPADEPTDKPADEPVDEPLLEDVPYVDTRVFDNIVQQAIIVTAEAYYNRGKYLQYDDTSFVASTDLLSRNIRRPDRLKYNPEDANSQFTWYSNCASWTYDVYYQALGIDIVNWTTVLLKQDEAMHVWSYTVEKSLTNSQKQKIFDEFSSKLQPGDIMVCRHTGSGGHALLYLGDGKILHSAAGFVANYNYTQKTEFFEEEGTVMQKTLDSLMDNDDNYYFFGEGWWGIVRPTLVYTDATPTQETLDRIANMQQIVAEKRTTAPTGHTVKGGDEITFTFEIKNLRETDAVFEIVDTIPSNTTYVKGAQKVDGETLKWTVSVAAGTTKTVEYTVKVNANAKVGDIVTSNSTIDGVRVNCRPIYVAGNLSAEQQAGVTKQLNEITGKEVVNDQLVEQIYANIGITIELDTFKNIINSLLVSFKQSKTHFELNKESAYLSMVPPTMYGGYYTVTATDMWNGFRTKGIMMCQLMVGDVIICQSKVGTPTAYMYAGDGKLFTISSVKFGLMDEEASQKALDSIYGYNRFVVIRPAMAIQ